jgi:GTP-binding protein HflX
MLRKQMSATRKRIDEVRKHRHMMRENQHELGLPIVSLVGYTNAGKSSLLNRFCGSDEVTAKNRLFETLDPTRRRAKLLSGREVLVVDTVGFVQRLPEQLVAGFRATLEELSEADLVLHVVDVSSPTAAEQVGTVQATLARLRTFNKETPQLLVFNKVDRLEGGIAEELEQSLMFPWPGVVGHCQVSALTGIGLQALADAVEDTLLRHTGFGAERLRLLIPYTCSSDYAKMRGPPPMVKIDKEEHTADGYLVDVVASADAARQLRRFQVPSGQNAALAT